MVPPCLLHGAAVHHQHGTSAAAAVQQIMAGETGGGGGTGRHLPVQAPLIPFPGWDLGDPKYNENGPLLLLLDCFSAIEIVV